MNHHERQETHISSRQGSGQKSISSLRYVYSTETQKVRSSGLQPDNIPALRNMKALGNMWGKGCRGESNLASFRNESQGGRGSEWNESRQILVQFFFSFYLKKKMRIIECYIIWISNIKRHVKLTRRSFHIWHSLTVEMETMWLLHSRK